MQVTEIPNSHSDEKEIIDVEDLGIRQIKTEPWLPIRYLVALLCFLINVVSYIMRINLSVAIVEMNLGEDKTIQSEISNAPIYDWDPTIRSTVLSSFFWGFVLFYFPSGYIIQKYGVRIPVFVSILFSSLFTILYVPAASLGWGWACATRILLGVAQGSLIPTNFYVVAHWSLPGERGRINAFVATGQQLGTILAMSCSGVLSEWAGWPWVFYVSGALGVVAALIWVWLVADKPAQHRLISTHERKLIVEANGQSGDKKAPRPPWRAILTSPYMFALIVTHCVSNWGHFTLLTEIPSYLNGVLNFNLSENGYLLALPYFTMWLFVMLFSSISDWILNRKYISVLTSRRLWNSIAHYGSAVSLIVLSFVNPDPTVVVLILTIAVAVSAGMMVGHGINFIDLSPNFASAMIGISGTIANVFSILGPLITGFIVTDTSDASQWRIVFLITALFYIMGNTTFILISSSEVQHWNNPGWTDKRPKKSEERSLNHEVT